MSESQIVGSSSHVTHIDVWQVNVGLLDEWSASPEFEVHGHGWGALLVRLRDSDGFEGWGEASNSSNPKAMESAAGQILGKPLSSLRPSFLELHTPGETYWHRPAPPSPYAPFHGNIQFRLRHALAPLFEMALTDLLTRRAGVPFSHLFGGAWRDRVRVDYWMGRTTPADAARCARRALELGFTGIKLKSTLEDPNVERLEAIREAAGDTFKVTVDPNGRFYRLSDALPTIRAMDAVGNMSALEDPFPRFVLHETAELRRMINARTIVHIDPPESLMQVIQSGAAGGLNLDSHTQGLFNWRLQAGVAHQANLPVWHGSGLNMGIATAAQLHLASSAPNCQLPGDQAGPWLRESHLVKQDFKVEAGHLIVPTGPGLGVEVDMAAVDKYTRSRQSFKA